MIKEEMLKLRDFRSEMESNDYSFTVPDENINKLVSVGVPYIKRINVKVGMGDIALTYVHNPVKKLMARYYQDGGLYTMEEWLDLFMS